MNQVLLRRLELVGLLQAEGGPADGSLEKHRIRTPRAALRALSACSASNSARFLAIAFGMAPGSLAFAAAAASAPALSSQGALRRSANGARSRSML